MKFDTKVLLGNELLGLYRLNSPLYPKRSQQLFLRSLKNTAHWLGGDNDILKAPYINPHDFPKLTFCYLPSEQKGRGIIPDFVIRLPIKVPRLSAVYDIRLNVHVNCYAGCIDRYSLSVQFWKEAPWQELTELKSREDIFRFLRGFSTQCLQ